MINFNNFKMSKRIVLVVLILLVSCHKRTHKFNLGFENLDLKTKLHKDWFIWGEYDVIIDTLAFSGKYSSKISSNGWKGNFGSIAYSIPANYDGDCIKLEGYMKTRDVNQGFSGLLLRIDGNNKTLAFNNMNTQNIDGTRDWQKYSIELDYPDNAKDIFIAGMLMGKGEAWFDDFVVTIDGMDIQFLEETKKRDTGILGNEKQFNNYELKMPTLTNKVYGNLELLGRVWGFLKYYHQQIGRGKYDWDNELLKFLPKYLEANNELERDKKLLDWINRFGEVLECNSCLSTNEKAFLKPDLKWIEEDIIDKSLKNKLLFIYKNRYQGSHHYVELEPNVGNPIFNNEDSYSNFKYPKNGLRLLSVFRYWNIINYFFPYKHLTDKDWNVILREYIPIFLNAKNELDYELAVIQLIGEVKDTHANLWRGGDKVEEWKGQYYPPINVKFIENKLVVVDYFSPELEEEIGLKIGDVITEIDGKSVSERISNKEKYYPASNKPTMLRNMAIDILRSQSTKIEISYIRDEIKKGSIQIPLFEKDNINYDSYYKKEEDRKSFEILEENIGYVNLKYIKDQDISQLKKELKDTKGIIIDIRNYPSAFVPFTTATILPFLPLAFLFVIIVYNSS